MTAHPIAPGDVGWPRPRHRAVHYITAQCLGEFPAPWVADYDPAEGFVATAYDAKRSTRMCSENLCQVCGGHRSQTVYVLVGVDQPDVVELSGGALCSLRCARLTAAVCPHYRSLWPVLIYAVPHPGARTSIGGMRELDDRVCISVTGARHVATIGDQP